MCYDQEQQPLSTTQNGRITWCKSCRKYSLIFMTSCAAFDQEELIRFAELLANLQTNDFNYEVNEGPHVLLKNHCSSVGLCLDIFEVVELQELVEKALLLRQAYSLISKAE